ncbi:phosphotransferase [Nesterenkonia sp. CL21]|uniref:phosphotransferase n=1 Tax=Nesterenkonia sp. CL21 TaxID=3064894 RepID=UPI002879A8D1|nr:phosphotransferase [Nesterenkonia sp. CL21]MDS2172977.1 phosphotransferase [Nesterenkonia sp. CL21]
MEHEQPLTGGNVSDGVVRIGDTVRKPWSSATPSVHAFLTHLRDRGVDVPRVLGRDSRGRQILEFIPGLTAEGRRLTCDELHRAGALVRRIHDGAAQHRPAEGAPWENVLPALESEMICHNDLTPWNLVVGERFVFIDWDGAGPSSRLWDLAYSAQAFTANDSAEDPEAAAARLAAFVDGYGADHALRAALPRAMGDRTAAMHRLLRESHMSGREPWGSMYLAGHGEHWAAATAYVRAHEQHWRAALLPHP